MKIEKELLKIKAQCHKLLAAAEKRTPGVWQSVSIGNTKESLGYDIYTDKWPSGTIAKFTHDVCQRKYESQMDSNASYIVSCTGSAEASWRSLIATIDGLLELLSYSNQQPTLLDGICPYGCDSPTIAEIISKNIISAWSGILDD